MAGFPKVGDEYGGRYRIVRDLGHGGMGIVYEAVDTVLNRSVALKIVLPSLPDREDFQARFEREASVLARIRSRNIVVIHEYGEHDDTVFFVTELFPDGDLHRWLSTHGPLDRRSSLALTAQVCEALADAHAAGVVHRDVKPGNVLLWNRPEGLIPYLCDFGIAIEDADARAGLTRTGTLIGSPAYMAPERHFGHAADVRGDVYSAGCLLWAVLTGDAPYSGTDFQMMNSHINGPVPQLGTGDPVDDRIDEVLAEALNKDPERRTASAAALRSSLLDILGTLDGRHVGGPAVAPAPPAAARATHLPAAVVGRPDHEATPAPSTVIRPTAARAGVPLEPVATEGGSSPRRRRWVPAALVAAGAVAAVTVSAVLVSASLGEDGRPAQPRAGAGSTAPALTSDPSEDPAPLARPGRPTASAAPGYRSVRFRLSPPRPRGSEPGVEHAIQVDAGDGWQVARGRYVLPTEQGGDRGCIRIRSRVEDTTGQKATSAPRRVCGKAQPRRVRLVRTDDACSAGYGCHWYDVRVEGFASGAHPQAFVYDSSGEPWCDCTFRRVEVGKDGRGAQVHEWQVTPGHFNSTVTLDVDGVRQQVFVP